nr:uncharacterized protein LOC103431319 isoform X3 [Malus domestica]
MRGMKLENTMKWIAGLMLWNLTLGLQLLGRLSLNQILTDTWCSSGGLSANGTLVQTGGWAVGGRSVRYLSGCNTCDWEEHPMSLSASRWFQISNHHISYLACIIKEFDIEIICIATRCNDTSCKDLTTMLYIICTTAQMDGSL